jgi:hypothetical protein
MEMSKWGNVMVDNILYEDEKDLAMHHGAIHDLSRDSGLPESVITEIYEQNLRYLKKTARVKDYLLVITYRIVRESLRYQH